MKFLKKLLLGTFLALNFNLYSVDFICLNNCKLDTIGFNIAFNDFIKNEKPNEKIILVDIMQKEDTNIFNFLESINTFELFYKKPDYYFMTNSCIIYIYTKEYTKYKDSLQLSLLFFETQKVLYFNERKKIDYYNKTGQILLPTFKSKDVCWKNDSVKTPNMIITSNDMLSFDPLPIEYQISKGLIVSKKTTNKVIFPDVSKPKGLINTIRGLPNWSY